VWLSHDPLPSRRPGTRSTSTPARVPARPGTTFGRRPQHPKSSDTPLQVPLREPAGRRDCLAWRPCDSPSPESKNTIEGLAVLRNLTAHWHDQDVPLLGALEFIALVDAVFFALRNRAAGS